MDLACAEILNIGKLWSKYFYFLILLFLFKMLHSSLYLLFIKNETNIFNWSQIWPLKENYFRPTLGSPTFICPFFRFVTHIALSWPSFPTHWSSVCSIKVFVKLDSDLRYLWTANVSMVTESSLSKYSSHRKIDSKCSHFKVTGCSLKLANTVSLLTVLQWKQRWISQLILLS